MGGYVYFRDFQLQTIQTNIIHSYAMTETITHVALRKVNGQQKSDDYHALKGVRTRFRKIGATFLLQYAV